MIARLFDGTSLAELAREFSTYVAEKTPHPLRSNFRTTSSS